MSYYADLDRNCLVDHGAHVRAVGWLDREHPYPRGSVAPWVLDRLRHHIRHAWQPLRLPRKGPLGLFGVVSESERRM